MWWFLRYNPSLPAIPQLSTIGVGTAALYGEVSTPLVDNCDINSNANSPNGVLYARNSHSYAPDFALHLLAGILIVSIHCHAKPKSYNTVPHIFLDILYITRSLPFPTFFASFCIVTSLSAEQESLHLLYSASHKEKTEVKLFVQLESDEDDDWMNGTEREGKEMILIDCFMVQYYIYNWYVYTHIIFTYTYAYVYIYIRITYTHAYIYIYT